MALETEKLLDETGWRLLQELQQNARLSYTELGQRIGLSLPSVAERVRKMEEAGIITGYHAEVNLSKLGMPVQAVIQLQGIGGQSCRNAVSQVCELPEVLECSRVTGSDSIIVRVVATSLDHLAKVIDQLSLTGIPATSIIRAKPMKRHVIPPEILERGASEDDFTA
ncbi:Lrp/AsnC family transcriptional regulator [Dictyobacter formicarum]|uniref:AsnC family transcriptional regulator n=1 Tax=Dictyobacter formicarum TaxID=2778368 RepID=A0ABQ3VBP2_9CHLR|nr:Lrp/AsnC family transcriptional regulator [Dictyobacter formicarum]GHO83121.1 AsnC family transcriptional regulator [Dictyobacter formicarum]